MSERGQAARVLLPLLVGLALVGVGLVTLAAVYDGVTVRSATMRPALDPGDRVSVVPVEGPDDVRAGDVVVLRPSWLGPDAPEVLFRVLAVGGQRVVGTADGSISVDGEPLDEPYLERRSQEQPFEAEVPDGALFVAGDARAVANDSRLHTTDDGDGSVPVSAVSGRVVGTSWPVWHWGVVDAGALGVLDQRPGPSSGTPWPFVVASLLVVVGAGAVLVAVARTASLLARRRRDGGREAVRA